MPLPDGLGKKLAAVMVADIDRFGCQLATWGGSRAG